jgi:5,10-methylenetetrahydrofolate reductase
LGRRHSPRRGAARRSTKWHGRQVQRPSRRLRQCRRTDRRPEEDRPVPDQRCRYPEKHPDSADDKADLENLKRKVDAGADRCITQFFFEADDFLRFRDRAAAAGVNVPIVPGVMPVSNFQSVARIAGLCGSKVPAWLAHLFDGLDDDLETRRMIAATVAGDLCRRLHNEGVEQFHFYTLNRADLTFAICHLLGMRPARDGDGR